MSVSKIILSLIIVCHSLIVAQVPSILWQNAIGGEWDEVCLDGIEDDQGNIYVVGYTNSEQFYFTDNHDTSSGFISTNDFLVVKLSRNGDTIWTKLIGGSQNDFGHSIDIANDGNILISGYSYSNDFDVLTNNGNSDLLIVKLSVQDGSVIWSKSYGGSDLDETHIAVAVTATNDGGCAVLGTVLSNDFDVHGHNGTPGSDQDVWVLKLDINGDTLWTRVLGGTDNEESSDIILLSDGNLVTLARSNSNDVYVHGNHSPSTTDYWVTKLNVTNGDTIWSRCYGGTAEEIPYYAKALSDGNIVVVGSSASDDGDVQGIHGSGPFFPTDYWLVKINSTNGDTIWTATLGGNSDEEALKVEELCDGGLLVSGVSYTNIADGDKSEPSAPGNAGALWMIKLDDQGNKVWDKTISSGGAPGQNRGFVMSTIDGRYFVGSYTNSDSLGDKTSNSIYNNSNFNQDLWFLKLELPISDSLGFIANTVCLGNETMFLDTSLISVDEWSWDFGDPASGALNNDSVMDPTHLYTNSGTFDVTLVTTYFCQKDTVLGTVVVESLPIINITDDTTISIGDSALIAVNQHDQYLWTSLDNLNCDTCQSNWVSPLSDVIYTVLVTSVNGCTDSASVNIFVEVPLPPDSFYLYIPNAFSPNGDGMNDQFQVIHSGLLNASIKIYNRSGRLVFESSDENNLKWDGKVKGKMSKIGAYTYHFTANSTDGDIQRKGNLNIMR